MPTNPRDTSGSEPTQDRARVRILDATLDQLREHGLADLTLDRVARRAGCAKGLVNYHFGTKARLLEEAARQLGRQRTQTRREALDHPPIDALTALWDRLAGEATRGDFALWVGLLERPGTGEHARAGAVDRATLLDAVATTFGIGASNPLLGTIPAMLDGFQLLLLQGAPEGEVRELFDQYWLALLEEP